MKKIKDIELFQKIRSFLTEYLPVIRAKSSNTIDSYRIAINLYLTYIQQSKNISLSEIRKKDFNQADIISFLNWLEEERANSINTRNQRLVNIRQFCKYLMSSDILSYAEYAMIQQIAKKANPKKYNLVFLSIEEMKLVLKQPDTKKKTGIRDRFYLALLYDSGCRNQEMLDLKLKDFVNTGNTAELHILGKGKKYRVTPISKDVANLFVSYCDFFHPHKQLNEYIFYTKRSGITTQMSADNVARFMKKYENQIKIIKPDITHLHPHLFRNTRAMHLYLAGMPLPLVSEWLGHSQLETTSIYYARATTEMKRNAVEKITNVENSVFKAERFKYENDDEVIKRLYGLA